MKIKCCRSCKSKSISKVFDLGKQALTGVFPQNKKEKIDKENSNKGAENLNMDDKSEFKGQEYDGVREMVKAIKKSLGPKRVG